nr:hypothetical protein [Tanacetum cinerariifolium]GFB65513.1 hypothetical protein [Tanacetum cinerariifolium]
NNNKYALVDGKEHDIQNSVSPDIHSSSSAAQTRKQGDKTENKDKEVWPDQLEIKVEYHRCSMKTFILACLLVFFHKRNPNESIKLSRIQVGLKPCKKSSFSSDAESLDLS